MSFADRHPGRLPRLARAGGRPISLLFALLLVFALDAAAQSAGRILFAAGDVSITRAGRELRGATNTPLESGDVVATGLQSNAQLGFTDGGVVALRASSRFAISEYRFTGGDDGTSNAVFRLIKGGIRTLTGLIGGSRRDRYRMSTPLATVGIRGTAYGLVQCEDDCEGDDGGKAPDGSYGVVYEGRVAVGTAAGAVEFGPDEAFFVADAKSLPQALVARPRFLRDRLEARARREAVREAIQARVEERIAAQREAIFAALAAAARRGDLDARPIAVIGSPLAPIVAAELRDASGNVALLGPGLGAGVGFTTSTTPVALVDGGFGTVIALDAQRGLLDGFSFNGGAQAGDRLATPVLDNGRIEGDGGAVWGRWAPGAGVSVNGQVAQPPTGVHFFFGNLTPEALFANVPAGAFAVRYDYVGGPRPTDGDGHVGQFGAGALLVNFVNRTVAGAINYEVNSVSYTLPIPVGTPLGGGRGFVGFNVTARDSGQWSCACNGASGTIDQYTVSGLFLGSRAQGIGATFGTHDAQAGRTAGAAIFRCVSGGCR